MPNFDYCVTDTGHALLAFNRYIIAWKHKQMIAAYDFEIFSVLSKQSQNLLGLIPDPSGGEPLGYAVHPGPSSLFLITLAIYTQAVCVVI